MYNSFHGCHKISPRQQPVISTRVSQLIIHETNTTYFSISKARVLEWFNVYEFKASINIFDNDIEIDYRHPNVKRIHETKHKKTGLTRQAGIYQLIFEKE